MRTHHLLPLILTLLFPVLASAQTRTWLVQPNIYQHIEPLPGGYFYATSATGSAILTPQGVPLNMPQDVALGGTLDGVALLTAQGGKVAVGCVDANTVHEFPEPFTLIEGNDFFSEGRLAVADSRGRLGYVDTDGRRVLGFNRGWTAIKPFTEQHAAVWKGKKYSLIDTSGAEADLRVSGARITGGINVYLHQALVWDTRGKFYSYDTTVRSIRGAETPPDQRLDYLYRLAAETFAPVTAPLGPSPRAAMPDGLAARDGGIVRMVEGQSFSFTAPTPRRIVTASLPATCTVGIDVPPVWQGKDLTVTARTTTGTVLDIRRTDGGATVSLPRAGTYTVRLSVRADNLDLAEDTFSVTVALPETPKTTSRPTKPTKTKKEKKPVIVY